MRRVVATFAIVVVLAGCSLLQDPVVTIESGLSPRMTEGELVTDALDRIRVMEAAAGRVEALPRIVSLSATTAAGLAALEPNAGFGEQRAAAIVVWLVRAEGTFLTERGRGVEPLIGTSGYFVIADADGSVIGFGMP